MNSRSPFHSVAMPRNFMPLASLSAFPKSCHQPSTGECSQQSPDGAQSNSSWALAFDPEGLVGDCERNFNKSPDQHPKSDASQNPHNPHANRSPYLCTSIVFTFSAHRLSNSISVGSKGFPSGWSKSCCQIFGGGSPLVPLILLSLPACPISVLCQIKVTAIVPHKNLRRFTATTRVGKIESPRKVCQFRLVDVRRVCSGSLSERLFHE